MSEVLSDSDLILPFNESCLSILQVAEETGYLRPYLSSLVQMLMKGGRNLSFWTVNQAQHLLLEIS